MKSEIVEYRGTQVTRQVPPNRATLNVNTWAEGRCRRLEHKLANINKENKKHNSLPFIDEIGRRDGPDGR